MSSSSEEEEFVDDDELEKEESNSADEESEDEPISALAAKSSKPNERTAPTGSPRSARTNGSAKKSYAEDSDDSDDDMPLAALAKKQKSESKKNNSGIGSKSKQPPAVPLKKKTTASTSQIITSPKKKKTPTATTTTSSSSSSDKKYEYASAALYGTESIKGLLVQRLLCRWWYAYNWPDASVVDNNIPHYDALDGFPGVSVCTEGDNVGAILDKRDSTMKPSFANFVHKSSAELQGLLIRALEEQKRLLIGAEGQGTCLEKELSTLLKWTKGVSADKADKEAIKVLKAQGIKL
jgi:hypothetical protein